MDKTSTYIKTAMLALLFGAFATGCGGGDSDTFKLGSGGGTGSGGSNSILRVTMQVAFIPTTVEINRAASVSSNVEYRWSMDFDMDGDNTLSIGDLRMMLYRYKPAGATLSFSSLDSDEFTGYLVETTGSDGNGWVLLEILNVTVDGDTITLSLPSSSDYTLGVDSDTPVRFATFDQNNGDFAADYYPNNGSFTSIPSEGSFTDDQGELGTTSLIDLHSMTVSLTP